MSSAGGWGDFTALAKSAISTAQKKIDKVLEIQENEQGTSEHQGRVTQTPVQRLQDDFISAFGFSSGGSESDTETAIKWSSWLPSKSNDDSSESESSLKRKDKSWTSWLGGVPYDETAPSSAESRLETVQEESEPLEKELRLEQPEPVCKAINPEYEEVDLLTPVGSHPFDSGHLDLVEDPVQSEPVWSEPVLDDTGWSDGQFPIDLAESCEKLLRSQDSDTTFVSPQPSLVDFFEPKTLQVEVNDCVCAVVERVVADLSPDSARPVKIVTGSETSPVDSSPPLTQCSLVKGSGYTSPNDDISSSDIEIISTPNGDSMSGRSSLVGWTTIRSHKRANSDQSQGLQDVATSSSHDPADKKVMHLAQVLESRELKLIELSRENMRLIEENESLRFLLTDQEETVGLEEALNNLKEKYSKVSEENDILKQKCETLGEEIGSAGVSTSQLQRVIQQKEEQIQELIAEGAKLSKQELKHSSIIKKLRQKEKETEKLVENQKTKLNEMESLRQKLKEKDEQELKYDDMVSQLKSGTEKQEKRIRDLQRQNEISSEKCASFQVTVDNCYKQISELQRDKAFKESELQSVKSEMEASREQELQGKLDQLQKDIQSERIYLNNQIEELRLNLAQTSDEATRRETSFKWEIGQLQKKLEEADLRNQELSEGVSSATVPLIRQIESLQSSHSVQQTNWERLEKALYDRIHAADRKLTDSAEKERQFSNAQVEFQIELDKWKAELLSCQIENQKLQKKVDSFVEEKLQMEQVKLKFQSDIEHERKLHRMAVEEIEKEKDLLQSQFDFEKNQLKSQNEKSIQELKSQLEIKEQALVSLRSQLVDQQLSIERSQTQSSSFDRPERPASVSPSSTSHSLVQDTDESWWTSELAGAAGFTGLVERLRARLQQREAELNILRDEVRSLQISRDNVANQLTLAQRTMHDAQMRLLDHDLLLGQHKELNEKYQALLTMYGGKVEENEELKLDLEDVKSMLREQIEDLVNQQK